LHKTHWIGKDAFVCRQPRIIEKRRVGLGGGVSEQRQKVTRTMTRRELCWFLKAGCELMSWKRNGSRKKKKPDEEARGGVGKYRPDWKKILLSVRGGGGSN